MAIADHGRFLIRNVLSSSFEIYRRHFWSFSFITLLGYILLLAIVVLAVIGILLPAAWTGDGVADFADIFAAASSEQTTLMVVVGVIGGTLCLAALQLAAAAVCYGTAQDMRDQIGGIGACLGRAFAVVLPVLGVSVLLILLMCVVGGVLGFLLSLINGWVALLTAIPLIYIYIRLWVAIPVIVVERPGIVASFSRSLRLTRGEALRIFGILLILIVISIVTTKILDQFGESSLGGILSVVVQVIISTFGAIVTTVGYVELRRAKEGFGVQDLAAVFD